MSSKARYQRHPSHHEPSQGPPGPVPAADAEGTLGPALLSWFIRHGGQVHSDVQLLQSHDRGFHVRASTELAAPFAFGSCPLTLTLSYLNLDQSQQSVTHIQNSELLPFLHQIPHHVLSKLVLIEQWSLGEKSFWWPYIACLPREFTTLPFLQDDELELLKQTTNLYDAAAKRQDAWDNELTAALTVTKGSIADESLYKSHYKWAASIFTSRAFVSTHILPETPIFSLLFPVIDSLNHAPRAKVLWDFKPLKSFTLQIEQNYSKGAEIFNNYAPKANDELLMGYGFALEDNPFEQTTLKVRLPDQLSSWLRPNLVPFEMDKTAAINAEDKELYVRPRNHPFGGYDNTLACFRGVPPAAVFAIYLLSLYRRRTMPTPGMIPDGRIVMSVLTQIAAVVKSKEVPFLRHVHLPKTPLWASIEAYRSGQLKMLRSVHSEIMAPLRQVLFLGRPTSLPSSPVVISVTEAIAQLSKELDGVDDDDFIKGVVNGLSWQAQHSTQAAAECSSLETFTKVAVGNDGEDLVWMLWLIYASVCSSLSPDSLVHSWLTDLKMPTLQSTSSDPIEIDEQAEWVLATLNGIVSSVDDSSYWRKIDPELHPQLVAWACQLVPTEGFQLEEQLLDGEEVRSRYCMYMRPATHEAGARQDEGWMFAE